MKRIKILGKWVRIALILLGALILLYPVLWMVSSSFKPSNIIFTNPGLIPTQFTLRNYVEGWKGISGVGYGTFFKNSFTMVLLAIAGNLLSCPMTAYAFARLKFRMRGVFFAIMLVAMMMPVHVLVIPQYVIFSKLGWTNSLLPIVIPKFFAADGFFIFLSVQFIRGIPYDLDEAAIIDGCGRLGVFLRILLPLMVPVIITTVIFTFVWTWNNFFSQLLYINTTDRMTVTLALRIFLDADETEYGAFYAMSTLSVLPIFILFAFSQRYLVEGIATSGLKG